MVQVCRACLASIAPDSIFFRLDTLESDPSSFKHQLISCVPEMAVDTIPDAIICNACSIDLHTAYKFRQTCLQTEEKLAEFLQDNDSVVDLSQFVTAELQPEYIDTIDSIPSSNDVEIDSVELIEKKPKIHKIFLSHAEEDEVMPDDLESSVAVSNLINDFPAESSSQEAKFICTWCSRGFLNFEIYNKHIQNHMNVKYLRCKVCGRTFNGMSYLMQHMKTHTRFNLSPCKLCKKTFTSASAFAKHIQVHENKYGRILNEKDEVDHFVKPRGRTSLPKDAKKFMRKWLYEHIQHPYPSETEKKFISEETNLTLIQVTNWFINARRRYLHPVLKNRRKHVFQDKDVFLLKIDNQSLINSGSEDEEEGNEEEAEEAETEHVIDDVQILDKPEDDEVEEILS